MGGAITGMSPTSAGPSFANVGIDKLVKRTQNGLYGYDYASLGSNKTTTVGPVNADHTTIQSGIDAANEGDVVEVFPGVYHEALKLRPGVILYCHCGS